MPRPEYLVIITGLSGSGKSYVQSTLEDVGFYCCDNLPIELIEPFLEEVGAHENADRVGIVVDVRFLPNPHVVEELRPKTGLDPEVVEYLKAQPGYDVFYDKLLDFVTYLLPEYQKEMKSYLSIGIGCTGGKHRSVAIGQRLAEDLAERGYAIEIVHRDCKR